MARRNFSRKLRAQIIDRAMNEDGQIVCEGCGLVLGKKPYQIDHILEEALVIDKSAPLTPEDGQLLGQDCCHAPKTAERIGMIRKADRQRDVFTGAKRSTGRPIPGSKRSRFKKKLDGTVVLR